MVPPGRSTRAESANIRLATDVVRAPPAWNGGLQRTTSADSSGMPSRTSVTWNVAAGATGPTVRRAASTAWKDSSQHTSPAELMEARLAMEPAIIEMAIRNANPADLKRMDACCDNAENAETLEAFEHWDAELHQAIADAAHNSFVANVFKLMKTVRAQGDWGQLKKKSVTPERRMAYQAEHRAIVDALRDRDATRARELTLAHLLHVRQNLLGY